MALVIADRVRETTTSIGITAITLAGAATGCQTFSSAIGNSNTTFYTIADQSGPNWEVGIGTYTTSGNTLSRDTVLASSNAGALVVFLTGPKDVFVTYPAERTVYSNGPLGTPTSGTLTSCTGLPISTGVSGLGTNVATFLATPSSANLAAALTDETGTGSAVFANAPTFPAQINLTANSGYNIYASGTANNYLAGKLGIGEGPPTGQNFRLAKTLTGATYTYGFVNQATIATDSTTGSTFNYTGISTAASASISSVVGYNITLDSLGAGSSIGTMTGYTTGAFASATNNYGFYGAIASGTGRYNLYMAGTADNYLAGSLGIGTASPSAKLQVIGSTTISSQPNVAAVFGPGVTSDLLVGSINGNSPFIASQGAYPLVLLTNATERVRIDSSGNVGIGTSSPSASAILDAQSTTKGVRFPNMTTTQKNAVSSPAAGLVVFDTTLSKLCVYTGAAWQTITSV